MSLDTTQLRLRAEFYLCMARAFQPPMHEEAYTALRKWLPADLGAIVEEAALPGGDAIAGLGAAVAQVAADHSTLLQGYSALFLVPPICVSLNADVYLDRALMGNHTIEMVKHYERYGLERSDDFTNAPDHLSMQLEFLAYLLFDAAEAGRDEPEKAQQLVADAYGFAGRYMIGWLPRMSSTLASEGHREPAGRFYQVLTDLLAEVIESELRMNGFEASDGVQEEASPLVPQLPDVESPVALEAMIRDLEAAGLDAGHLRAAATQEATRRKRA